MEVQIFCIKIELRRKQCTENFNAGTYNWVNPMTSLNQQICYTYGPLDFMKYDTLFLKASTLWSSFLISI